MKKKTTKKPPNDDQVLKNWARRAVQEMNVPKPKKPATTNTFDNARFRFVNEPTRDEPHQTPSFIPAPEDPAILYSEIINDPNPTDHINSGFMKALLRRFPDLRKDQRFLDWAVKNWAGISEKI